VKGWLPVLLAVAAGAAAAQAYPARPVKLIVPFPPGGGNDFIARFVARRLAPALGQPVMVENKPGAGGTIGIEAGLKAAPDGYTLTLISSAYTITPHLYQLHYDPLADIAPIIQMSRGPLLAVVNPSVPANNVQELIALAKSKPGTLNFASSGQGSTIHLAAELFALRAGIRMNHIPYKGTNQALTDTIGGQVDLYFSSTAAAIPQIHAGKLRALAATSAERLAAEPTIPTLAESGLPGYEVILWHGLAGPKGLPRAVIDRINAEVSAVVKSTDAAEQLQTDGVMPMRSTPGELGVTLRREIELWRKVIQDAGIKLQ
jgi:tripartite-type tricarboxylate transporter receptor subunit TctC